MRWEARNRTDGLQNIYIAGTQHEIALCCRPRDASLIISVHDLLDACKAAIPEIEREDQELGNIGEKKHPVVRQLLAAISKAERV